MLRFRPVIASFGYCFMRLFVDALLIFFFLRWTIVAQHFSLPKIHPMTPENSRSDPPEAPAPDGAPPHTHDQKAINAALAGAAGMLIGRFLFGRHGGLLGGVAGLGAGYFLKRGAAKPSPVAESIEPDFSQKVGSTPAPSTTTLGSDEMVDDRSFSFIDSGPDEEFASIAAAVALATPAKDFDFSFEGSDSIASSFIDAPAGSAAIEFVAAESRWKVTLSDYGCEKVRRTRFRR